MDALEHRGEFPRGADEGQEVRVDVRLGRGGIGTAGGGAGRETAKLESLAAVGRVHVSRGGGEPRALLLCRLCSDADR